MRLAIALFVAAMTGGFVRIGSAQQQPLRQISSIPTCSRCRIVLESQALLRLPSESLSFAYGSQFFRAPNGSFLTWGLSETPSAALFDSSGTFVRVLSRVGTGPGEVGYVNPVVLGLGDSVWVLDEGRRHVYTPDVRYVRTERARGVSDLVVGPNATIVVSSRIATPDRAGFPLHVLDRDGEPVHSFGTADPTIDPRRLAALNDNPSASQLRFLTPGEAGTFWAWSITRFILERYDFAGRLLTQGRHRMDGWYAPASERRPGRGEFTGLGPAFVQASRQPEIIWIVYHDRNASFREPDEQTSRKLNPANPYDGMYDLVVEAVDAANLQVVAVQRFPKTAAARVRNGPDLLARYQSLDSVFVAYDVSRLRLLGSP